MYDDNCCTVIANRQINKFFSERGILEPLEIPLTMPLLMPTWGEYWIHEVMC